MIISNYAFSLVNLRGDLIKNIIECGHEVIAVAPENEQREQIEKLGAKYVTLPIDGTGLNPFKDLVTFLRLHKMIKRVMPDLLFSYTIKPVLYGSLAAWAAGIGSICSLFPGLGYLFTEKKGVKYQVLNHVSKIAIKLALSKNKVVFFQNPDDLALFLEAKLLKESTQAVTVHGSGVDLEKYTYTAPKKVSITFLLIARLIWDKGIGEYVKAARFLKPLYPEVGFRLLGPSDSNPSAISTVQVDLWIKEGVIDYLGETDDVRPYLADTSVFVLPSLYREGTPRSVLEAMAMGRPIITTDVAGCRETVQDGINGFLVPPRDINALISSMEKFIKEPELIEIMGLKSREFAIQKFDVQKVNRIMLGAMDLI